MISYVGANKHIDRDFLLPNVKYMKYCGRKINFYQDIWQFQKLVVCKRAYHNTRSIPTCWHQIRCGLFPATNRKRYPVAYSETPLHITFN